MADSSAVYSLLAADERTRKAYARACILKRSDDICGLPVWCGSGACYVMLDRDREDEIILMAIHARDWFRVRRASLVDVRRFREALLPLMGQPSLLEVS